MGSGRSIVLYDTEAYGVGMATSFRRAAEHLGLDVVGFEGWDTAATGYASLFERVGSSRADAVFLGGLVSQNGGKLIKDKVSVLGPNDGDVKLLAADGFERRATVTAAGAAADGMYLSVAGVPG